MILADREQNAAMALAADLDRWLRERHRAVLVTIRSDGTPQTSNVVFAYDGSLARVSVTAGRAKTRNLARDPRGVLHVLGSSFWEYASVRVTAELSTVTSSAGDEPGQELLELYRAASGADHPDPAEFLAAMVAEQRLVLRLTPVSAVGSGLPD